MEMSLFIRFEYSTVIFIFKKVQAGPFKDENKKSEYLWEVTKTPTIFFRVFFAGQLLAPVEGFGPLQRFLFTN